MSHHRKPLVSAASVAGVAALAFTATSYAPARAVSVPHNEQVALTEGTNAQPLFESDVSGSGQVTSHDGRFVVFSTAAPLVAEDTNELDDVYVRDTREGTTTLVSERKGVPGNDYSVEPTISADGNVVTFTTWATNLAKDTNGSTLDVLVKHLDTGRIQRVSVTTDGKQQKKNSFSPVISGDGRSVAFQTFGQFAGTDRDKAEDVYVRDLVGGKTKHVSRLPDGRDVPGSVLNGDISDDGNLVVFGDTNNLWVRDVAAKQTTRLWQEPDSPPCQDNPAGSAGRPVISGNGKYVAFSSCATDLPGENGRHSDIYRITLRNGHVVRANPKGNADSYLASLSRSGRYVGFGSDATNLVAGDDEGQPDAFVVDVRSGAVSRASQGVDGVGGNSWSATTSAAISGDGQTLAYTSYADNLVEGDESDLPEVFLWRR